MSNQSITIVIASLMTGVQLRTAFPERQGRALLNLCQSISQILAWIVYMYQLTTVVHQYILLFVESSKKLKREKKNCDKKNLFCTFCTFYIVPYFPRKISTASTIDLIMILLIVWLVITEECHTSLFLNSFNHMICKLPAILHQILSLAQVLCSTFLRETLNLRLQIFVNISFGLHKFYTAQHGFGHFVSNQGLMTIFYLALTGTSCLYSLV